MRGYAPRSTWADIVGTTVSHVDVGLCSSPHRWPLGRRSSSPTRSPPIRSRTNAGRVQELTDELEQLEETSDILAEDYVTAIDEQRRLEAEVAAAAQQVAEREAEVDALRGELAEVAVQAFMGAGTNGLGPMFNDSSAYTEELQRDQLARVALSAGDATTDELDQAVADLHDQRAVLEDARTRQRPRPPRSSRRSRRPKPRRPSTSRPAATPRASSAG